MRLRNVKGANDIINASPYVISDFKKKCGSISDIFNNDNSIIKVEVGMGKGKFIVDSALKNKNINYIGIEKYDSVLVRAVEKQDSLKLPNLRFIRMDALNINEAFDHEIDTLYLNFSDPWPKDRHYKRRLTSPEFLKRYDTIFCGTKRIEMKTDNRGLFEYSLKSLSNYGYKIEDISLDLYKDDNLDENIATEYELKFVSKGNIIYKGIFIKDN